MANSPDFSRFVRDVPDFPEPGIVFKDITPLLRDTAMFDRTVTAMSDPYADAAIDVVVGIEARGFIFAAPIAIRLEAGFVPLRKVGKLPGSTRAETYDLEYGTATLEVHEDAFGPGDKVLIVDDVLATGGTAAAAARLIDRCQADVVGLAFLIELSFLDGARLLDDRPYSALITY
ncbi:adenine phosphoribosyltransferase [soil metagenome]